MLTNEQVQTMAKLGRVKPDPSYHAWQHFVGWEDIVYALQNCYWVDKDTRPDQQRGYVAWGHLCMTRRLRIDFNLATDDDGQLMLVVTAMPSR